MFLGPSVHEPFRQRLSSRNASSCSWPPAFWGQEEGRRTLLENRRMAVCAADLSGVGIETETVARGWASKRKHRRRREPGGGQKRKIKAADWSTKTRASVRRENIC